MAFGLRRAKWLGKLFVQLVSKISYLLVLIHQRYGQTDRQTDRRTDGRHAILIPRFALKFIAL